MAAAAASDAAAGANHSQSAIAPNPTTTITTTTTTTTATATATATETATAAAAATTSPVTTASSSAPVPAPEIPTATATTDNSDGDGSSVQCSYPLSPLQVGLTKQHADLLAESPADEIEHRSSSSHSHGDQDELLAGDSGPLQAHQQQHQFIARSDSQHNKHHHQQQLLHKQASASLRTDPINSTATSPTVAESLTTTIRPSLHTIGSTGTGAGHSPSRSAYPSIARTSPTADTDDIAGFLSALSHAAFDGAAHSPFAFSPAQLHLLTRHRARSPEALRALGGLCGLAIGLHSDPAAGLSNDETMLRGRIDFVEAVAAAREGRPPRVVDLESQAAGSRTATATAPDKTGSFATRRETYGAATGKQSLRRVRGRAFLGMLWRRLNDKLILVLLVSAIITLVLAACQAKNGMRKYKKDWAEAAAAVSAIVLIVAVRAMIEWESSRRFAQVDRKRAERTVRVVRSGTQLEISLDALQVGDVVVLQRGDVIPADGIVVSANALLVDEYATTGEPHAILKHASPASSDTSLVGSRLHSDPFLLSNTVVLEGTGTYLVTSFDPPAAIESFCRYPVPETPLQTEVGLLAKKLVTFGMLGGVLYFVILLIRYIIRTSSSSAPPIEKARNFFDILVNVSTVLLVSIPSGLVFSVLVTLGFAASRMLKEGNLVRELTTVETMGNVTCICTGKGGSLTLDEANFALGRAGHGEQCDFPEMFVRQLCNDVKGVLKNAITLNTNAFESFDSPSSQRQFTGPSIEVGLLRLASDHLALGSLTEEKAKFNVVRHIPFDSSSMYSATIAKLSDSGKYRLFVTGAAETILSHSDSVLDDAASSLSSSSLTLEIFESIDASIHNFGRRALRPIAIAYRDFTSADVSIDSIPMADLVRDLVFVSLIGFSDPLRPSMAPLVRECHQAGVFVRLVTGDNFSLAREVATKCGIFTPGGIVMDGPTFRSLSHWQLDLVVPRLQVLARATPEDKLLLVAHLRGMGETVATTGSSINDSLSLKAADVGLAFGCHGSEVTKQSASMVMLNENVYSLARALGWGRTVSDSVKKFLQFQLTFNITAGTLTVISTLVGTLIINIPQLLYINLVVSVLGILALTTDYPSSDLLARRPHLKKEPLITLTMWKMILCQALYQVLSILTIHYVGWAIFEPHDSDEISDLQTLVFNIYVMMQLFNQHNCRRVDNNINIHHQGIFKNPWFLICQAVIIIGQTVIITQGGNAFNAKPLNGYQWAWSVLFGFLTLPLGVMIRQIPDTLVYCIFQILLRAYRSLLHSLFNLLPASWRRHALHTPTSADAPHASSQWVLRAGEALLAPMSYRLCSKHDDSMELAAVSAGGGGGVPGQQRPALMTVPLRRARRQLQERLLNQKHSRDGLDLHSIVAFSRASLNPIESGLDIHPETGQNDPVLMKTIGVDGASDPPSQDPEIIKMLSLRSKH